MFVLNEEKLTLIFKEISEGFIPSPLEITFFILLICAIIAASILVYRHQKRKSRIEKILQAQKLYESILKKKALTPADLDLLDQLACYLKIPDEKNKTTQETNTKKLLSTKSGTATSSPNVIKASQIFEYLLKEPR